MSSATEEIFPVGSAVVVTDQSDKYAGKYGIVEGYSGNFGVKVRMRNGIIPTLDSSKIRVDESFDAPDTAPETQSIETASHDDQSIETESKFESFTAWPHWNVVWYVSVIAVLVLAVAMFPKKETPIPPAKTAKELAVERINARNVRIAPISDSCVILNQLKKENETDLKILFPQ